MKCLLLIIIPFIGRFCEAGTGFIRKHDVVYFRPQQVHLSASENSDNFILTWSTFNDTQSIVQYGSGVPMDQSQTGASKIFMDGGDEQRIQFIHKVTLTNLKPDTVYVYHVGSDDGWSDLFWFKTFPQGSDWAPRLVIYGDMGVANAASLPRLQQETQNGMYDMILHIGDFAYDMDQDNARVGDEFMNNIEAIAAYVPYMTCPGNHEEAYNFSNYKARFSMPGDEGRMYFSFNVGPIHFVSVSTEYYYYLNYGFKLVVNQYNWLVKDLEEASKPENRAKQPWIIVVGHRPMYCSSDDNDDCTKRETLTRVGLPPNNMFGMEELLLKYNVDLAIWAHEHDYERFWPVYDYKVLNGSMEEPYVNPRGPVQLVTGSAGNDEYHDPWIYPQPDITAFRALDYGFTRLTAHNSSHLEIAQVSDDKDGEIIDHFWIVSETHKFPSIEL